MKKMIFVLLLCCSVIMTSNTFAFNYTNCELNCGEQETDCLTETKDNGKTNAKCYEIRNDCIKNCNEREKNDEERFKNSIYTYICVFLVGVIAAVLKDLVLARLRDGGNHAPERQVTPVRQARLHVE
jgi:hypothetical protein